MLILNILTALKNKQCKPKGKSEFLREKEIKHIISYSPLLFLELNNL